MCVFAYSPGQVLCTLYRSGALRILPVRCFAHSTGQVLCTLYRSGALRTLPVRCFAYSTGQALLVITVHHVRKTRYHNQHDDCCGYSYYIALTCELTTSIYRTVARGGQEGHGSLARKNTEISFSTIVTPIVSLLAKS